MSATSVLDIRLNAELFCVHYWSLLFYAYAAMETVQSGQLLGTSCLYRRHSIPSFLLWFRYVPHRIVWLGYGVITL